MAYFGGLGIDREEMDKIVEKVFNENADILIGIDDPEVNQLKFVIVDAVLKVIEKNNKEIIDNFGEFVEEYLNRKFWRNG